MFVAELVVFVVELFVLELLVVLVAVEHCAVFVVELFVVFVVEVACACASCGRSNDAIAVMTCKRQRCGQRSLLE